MFFCKSAAVELELIVKLVVVTRWRVETICARRGRFRIKPHAEESLCGKNAARRKNPRQQAA